MRKSAYIVLSCLALLLLVRPASGQHAPDSGSINVLSEAGGGVIGGQLDELMHRADSLGLDQLPIGKRVVAMGRLLLERPYLDKTLEVGTDRYVVCNLEGFDCVTLFENAWALARLDKHPDDRDKSFLQAQLGITRYRDGYVDGFQSRLHYTTDYFFNNTQRGLLKEMTRAIGGKYVALETKPINFMTKHPNAYKQLKDDPAMVAKMDSVEKMINARGGFYYIKKENVEKIESGMQDGDLIGITTSIPGIDCSHTGIAVRGDDGRIHFMNASSVFHKVIISKEPLAEYLANNSKQTGIIVYRPIEQP